MQSPLNERRQPCVAASASLRFALRVDRNQYGRQEESGEVGEDDWARGPDGRARILYEQRVDSDVWERPRLDSFDGRLFSEYGDGSLATLADLMKALEHARAGAEPDMRDKPMPKNAGKLVHFESDVMRIGSVFFELGERCDPRVWEHTREKRRWMPSTKTFSSWMFDFFADATTSQDWVPRSFWGPKADHAASRESAPLAVHRSGLWLRAFDSSVDVNAFERISKNFPNAERQPLPNRTARIRLATPTGAVRITTDTARGERARSSWWLSAASAKDLYDLARKVMAQGTLRTTLRADTEAAAEVLQTLRSPKTAKRPLSAPRDHARYVWSDDD